MRATSHGFGLPLAVVLLIMMAFPSAYPFQVAEALDNTMSLALFAMGPSYTGSFSGERSLGPSASTLTTRLLWRLGKVGATDEELVTHLMETDTQSAALGSVVGSGMSAEDTPHLRDLMSGDASVYVNFGAAAVGLAAGSVGADHVYLHNGGGDGVADMRLAPETICFSLRSVQLF